MQTEQNLQPETGSDDEKTKKARMLISLLGADFTRSASHPFFKRLSQTAIGKSIEVENGSQADISGALTDLLSALNEGQARPEPKRKVVTPAPKPKAMPQRPAQPTPLRDATPDPLRDQHPAIIAQELQSMPQHQKTRVIKALSGPLARQVALYAKELGS